MGGCESKPIAGIESDDEFDRYGNPKPLPGLEGLQEEIAAENETSSSPVQIDVPDKVGAGLLIVKGERGEVGGRVALLLKRSMQSGNGGTWGLPGGNRDPGETDLWETALREAQEEMGVVEEAWLERLATVLTKRGKRNEKEYTVYVVRMLEEAWEPVLNEEHTAWEWVALDALLSGKKGKGGLGGKKLHPVVKIAVDEYGLFLQESLL